MKICSAFYDRHLLYELGPATIKSSSTSRRCHDALPCYGSTSLPPSYASSTGFLAPPGQLGCWPDYIIWPQGGFSRQATSGFSDVLAIAVATEQPDREAAPAGLRPANSPETWRRFRAGKLAPSAGLVRLPGPGLGVSGLPPSARFPWKAMRSTRDAQEKA